MRFPRVENFFNEEDEFEDVVCCDSELSPSIMDTIIENTLMKGISSLFGFNSTIV